MGDVNFEHCLAEITLRKHKLIVGSLYRAPNTNQTDFLNDYKKLIKSLKEIPESEIVLGMDHNLDFLKSHIHKNNLLI